MTVELLTAGMWHDSIGDLAVMQATLVELGRRGVACVPAFQASGTQICVIGGGALLSCRKHTRWSRALAPYRVSGPHVLNAVSVDGPGDFGWLRDYRYLSVRDPYSARHLAPYIRASIVPCPAVLLEPPQIDRTFPTFEFIPEEPYAVIDCELTAIPTPGLKRVIVDTRPWARRHSPTSFPHRNPDALLAVLKHASLTLCNTLHLSILSLAAGTPFAVDCRSRKCRHYWLSRCPALISARESMVSTALTQQDKILVLRDVERDHANRHLNRLVDSLADAG